MFFMSCICLFVTYSLSLCIFLCIWLALGSFGASLYTICITHKQKLRCIFGFLVCRREQGTLLRCIFRSWDLSKTFFAFCAVFWLVRFKARINLATVRNKIQRNAITRTAPSNTPNYTPTHSGPTYTPKSTKKIHLSETNLK